MGIRFVCPHCNGRLNVKDGLAGKRGFCPKCNGRIDIPTASDPALAGEAAGDSPGEAVAASTAAAAQVARPAAHPAPTIAPPTFPDPVAENPLLQWYVAPVGSTTPYGPASGDLFRQWIKEGRVGGESLVWRQDWTEWRRAADVLPQLQAVSIAPAQPAAAIPPPPGAVPAAPTAPHAAAPASTGGGVPSMGYVAPRRRSLMPAVLIALVLVVIGLSYVAYIVIAGRS